MVEENTTVLGDDLSPPAIDIFRPADAAGVAALYRAVYGDNYPVGDVYDPQKLVSQGETGEAYRVVARTNAGEVVGHIALYRSSPPNRNLYEIGQMMVRQDYRVGPLASRLFAYSLAELPARHSLEQLWGEAVCNHLVTQQMSADGGFLPAALEVDLMPAEAYTRAFSRPLDTVGRVATLALFRAFKAKPQTIYLPPMYEEALSFVYSLFAFGHSFEVSRREPPADAATRGRTEVFAAAGVARITLSAAGRDLAAYIEESERRARAGGAVVFQVYCPLTWPWAGAVAGTLRRQGYFLGGALPRWFDDDGLLMQKVLTESDFDGIFLYRKPAKKLLEFVRQDWLAGREG